MMRTSTPWVSVVIPARNEARNLEALLPELPPVHEVIVVDGHSRDDTVAAARRALPSVRVLTQTLRGRSNALICGIASADGEVIVLLDADADGPASPSLIAALVEGLVAGPDLVTVARRGYGAFWADILPVLQLPAPEADIAEGAGGRGRGNELDTIIDGRVARAGLTRCAVVVTGPDRTPAALRAGRLSDVAPADVPTGDIG